MTRAEWEAKRWSEKTRKRVLEALPLVACLWTSPAIIELDDGLWVATTLDWRRYRDRPQIGAGSLTSLVAALKNAKEVRDDLADQQRDERFW